MKPKYINYLTVLICALASVEIAFYASTSLTVSNDSNFWDGTIGRGLSNYTAFALILLITSIIVNKILVKKQKPSRFRIGIVWGTILLTIVSFVVFFAAATRSDNKNYGNKYKAALAQCGAKPVEITFISKFSIDGDTGDYNVVTPVSQNYVDYTKHPVDRNGSYLAFACSVSQAKSMLLMQGYVNEESEVQVNGK